MCKVIEDVRADIDRAWAEFREENAPLDAIEDIRPDAFKLVKASFDVAYTMGRHDQAANAVDDLAVLDNIEEGLTA